MAAWIFQGNPKNFDVDDYVDRYPELVYWRTPRYAKEISIGDRAFIWRAGVDSGVIALGNVVEQPVPGDRVEYPEALGDDLWRIETPDITEIRTGIKLLEKRNSVDEGMIPRELVKENPILSGSTIIRIPQSTVFKIIPEQCAEMERLLGLTTFEYLESDAGVLEGKRKLVYHYKRERSANLRKGKLDEQKQALGHNECEICGEKPGLKYPQEYAERIFEVHHLSPLSKASTPLRTTLTDLAVLCASCHRAVHVSIDVEENFAKLQRIFKSKT